jgi:hypothetical protein
MVRYSASHSLSVVVDLNEHDDVSFIMYVMRAQGIHFLLRRLNSAKPAVI